MQLLDEEERERKYDFVRLLFHDTKNADTFLQIRMLRDSSCGQIGSDML